jgi:N-acetylglutamate synthase/N-acetylornithine aminotransferase
MVIIFIIRDMLISIIHPEILSNLKRKNGGIVIIESIMKRSDMLTSNMVIILCFITTNVQATSA